MEGGGFNIHKKYSIVEKLSNLKSRLHTVYYKMLTWLLHTFTKSRSSLKQQLLLTTYHLPLGIIYNISLGEIKIFIPRERLVALTTPKGKQAIPYTYTVNDEHRNL